MADKSNVETKSPAAETPKERYVQVCGWCRQTYDFYTQSIHCPHDVKPQPQAPAVSLPHDGEVEAMPQPTDKDRHTAHLLVAEYNDRDDVGRLREAIALQLALERRSLLALYDQQRQQNASLKAELAGRQCRQCKGGNFKDGRCVECDERDNYCDQQRQEIARVRRIVEAKLDEWQAKYDDPKDQRFWLIYQVAAAEEIIAALSFSDPGQRET